VQAIKRAVGWLWASPLTVFGLLYTCAGTLFGWFKWAGIHGDVLLWRINVAKCPTWVHHRWHPCGHTFGNVAITVESDINSSHGRLMLNHVAEHVRQAMQLGPFFPVIYLLIWSFTKLVCKHANAHFSHPFEVECRRCAGQIIDIEGTVSLLQSRRKHST